MTQMLFVTYKSLCGYLSIFLRINVCVLESVFLMDVAKWPPEAGWRLGHLATPECSKSFIKLCKEFCSGLAFNLPQS